MYALALLPCRAQVFAVAMDRLMTFAATFGIPTENIASAVEFYRGALAKVPADLVLTAVDRICAGWKWGNRMPLPADLLAKVSEDLTRRRSESVKVSSALRAWQEPLKPVERKPEMAKKFSELVRSFGKGGDAA